MGFCILDELYSTIIDRLERRPEGSYTWSTASKGVEYVARKVGEEAVETILEAVKGDRERLAEEAVDLVYHLLLLLAMSGITPDDVERVVRGRMG